MKLTEIQQIIARLTPENKQKLITYLQNLLAGQSNIECDR